LNILGVDVKLTLMSTKQKPGYPLRMPDGLRDNIEKSAKESGRSLHAEIIHRLEEFTWVESESAERREIANNVMREKIDLLEDLSAKSGELHRANLENIKLREALESSGYPPEKMIGLEYERMKQELKTELLDELSDVVVDLVEERIIATTAERDE